MSNHRQNYIPEPQPYKSRVRDYALAITIGLSIATLLFYGLSK